MRYSFDVYKTKVKEHEFWVVESKELNGCVAQGDTQEEALKEFEVIEQEWLETAEEFGIPIPEPGCRELKVNEYSGKFTVRVAPCTHEDAVIEAKKQGISLNQYANDAIVAYNAERKYGARRTPVVEKVVYIEPYGKQTYGTRVSGSDFWGMNNEMKVEIYQ